MDPYVEGGMIFTAVMTIIIGVFIVAFPITRRLGALMEDSIKERRAARLDATQVGHIEGELGEMRSAVDRLEGHLGLLAERQDFVENLLGHREPERLPKKEDWQG